MRVAGLVLALWAAAFPAPRTDGVFAEVDRISRELAEISGMQTRRKVPCELISRDEVNRFLNKRVKEVATPEEIRAEESTLKKFGLVPQDFDLAKSTVDLLTEQAAAFYDFTKKRLFITDSTPSATREAALAHELAHAVADQNYNLGRFFKQAGKSDDGSLARMAVMEGQATWLMSEYLVRRMGQSLVTSPSIAELMSRSADTAAGQYPVFKEAPLYMRVTLIFPYSGGMRFQQAVVERDGDAAFGEVFKRAPVSTQQVIHPEKYFNGTLPTQPALPGFTERGYKTLAEGSLGELDHRILLEQYAGEGEAAKVAPHWRGGRYRLYEDRARRRQVLAYASEWDSPDAARTFFRLYRRVLSGKWKKLDIAADTDSRLSGAGPDGYFEVICNGSIVTSLEGAEAPRNPAIH
jgi:hypothetical protein